MNLHFAFALGAAASCAALGAVSAGRLSRRLDALCQWDKALLAMSGAIRYRRATALEAVGHGAREEGVTLPALLERMKTRPGQTPAALLRGLPWHPLLPKDAKDALSACLLSLFLPTLPQQEQGIARAMGLFSQCLNEARNAKDARAKLYAALGWLSGAALFILLC